MIHNRCELVSVDYLSYFRRDHVQTLRSQHLGKMAAEMEDIFSYRPKFCQAETKKIDTVHILAGLEREAEAVDRISNATLECENRRGHIWTCEKRTPNLMGGFFYHFRLNDELRSIKDLTQRNTLIQKINNKIYPAIEPLCAQSVQGHFSKCLPATENNDDCSIICPDIKAVRSIWKTFKDQEGLLSDLDVVSSDGIASDIEYALAYIAFDVLISEGKEFLHDIIFHLEMNFLKKLRLEKQLEPNAYVANKNLQSRSILKVYRRLMISQNISNFNEIGIHPKNALLIKQHIDNYTIVLGYTADVFSNHLEMSNSSMSYIQTLINRIWNNDYMKNELERRNINPNNRKLIGELNSLWGLIQEVEINYDLKRLFSGMDFARIVKSYKSSPNKYGFIEIAKIAKFSSEERHKTQNNLGNSITIFERITPEKILKIQRRSSRIHHKNT